MRNSVVASTPTFYDTIQSLIVPDSYFPLRETSGSVANDEGTLGNDGTITGLVLNSTAGPDGYNYMRSAGTSGHMVSIPDNALYTPSTNGGLTVGFMYQPTGTPGTQLVIASKFNNEWNIMAGAFTDYTEIYAQIVTTGGGNARGRYGAGGFVAGSWVLGVVKFAATTTGFPLLNVDGSNVSGTTIGSGTGGGDGTNPVRLFSRASGSAAGQLVGSLAHVWIKTGLVSDADLTTLAANAAANGW